MNIANIVICFPLLVAFVIIHIYYNINTCFFCLLKSNSGP
jgi:hypothetical protein